MARSTRNKLINKILFWAVGVISVVWLVRYLFPGMYEKITGIPAGADQAMTARPTSYLPRPQYAQAPKPGIFQSLAKGLGLQADMETYALDKDAEAKDVAVQAVKEVLEEKIAEREDEEEDSENYYA